jgi:exopolysaccharide biosynthesis polyprenyl glycosylphosphotransferase
MGDERMLDESPPREEAPRPDRAILRRLELPQRSAGPRERRRALEPAVESDQAFRGAASVETIAQAARRRNAAEVLALAAADLIAAAGALLVGVELLGDGHLRPAGLLALPLVLLASKLLGLYDRDRFVLHKSSLEEAPKLFHLATLSVLLIWVSEGAFVAGGLAAGQIAGMWATLMLLGLVGRAVARTAVLAATPEERCLVVGDGAVAEHLRTKLASAPAVNAKVVEIVPLTDRRGQVPWTALNLQFVATRCGVERILIAPPPDKTEPVLDLLRIARSLGIPVSVLPRVLEVVGSAIELEDVGGLPILGARDSRPSRSSRALKRAFDLTGAVVSLVLLAPFLALIAVAIKLDSPGPVLFRQRRVGRGGEVFRMLKLRTMHEDAERRKGELRELNEAEGVFKIHDDPRITRVGRLLRRASLDETPQLWNVLRGEMSLVGPRPLPEDEDQRVTGWDRERLDVSPGITGHWQVLGSARIPLHEMVRIDRLYAANWSLWLDLKLLLRTVPHVVARRGQ